MEITWKFGVVNIRHEPEREYQNSGKRMVNSEVMNKGMKAVMQGIKSRQQWAGKMGQKQTEKGWEKSVKIRVIND